MFRNGVVLRTHPPWNPSSPFLLRQLSLLRRPDLSPSPPSSLAVDVETLCWKICRRWRLACFLQPPDVFLIYQRAQYESVDRALEELLRVVPDFTIGMEEEVTSAALVAKAVEIWLRILMLEHKWTCVGDYTFVDSTFAGTEERSNVCALNLEVCPGTNSPSWIKATNHLACHIEKKEISCGEEFVKKDLISWDLKSSLDFRTPKPAICGKRELQLKYAQKNSTSMCGSSLGIRKDYTGNIGNICSTTDTVPTSIMKVPPSASVDSAVTPAQPRQPTFGKRKMVKVQKGIISSSQMTDSFLAEAKHISAGSGVSKDPPQRSKQLGNKKEKIIVPGTKSLEKSGKEVTLEISQKKARNNEKKKDNLAEDSKTRPKQCTDQSAIREKVANCYIRGELQSLTVADLKCFLAFKRAKVGGKKEELIKRVASLLT